jgi:hypothetical protein
MVLTKDQSALERGDNRLLVEMEVSFNEELNRTIKDSDLDSVAVDRDASQARRDKLPDLNLEDLLHLAGVRLGLKNKRYSRQKLNLRLFR